jgi:hypothetical protein
MPKCVACNSLLPSKVFPLEDSQVYKCVFCIRCQDTFEHGNIDDGFEIYDRKKMVEEYKTYLTQLSHSPNIAKLLVKCEQHEMEKNAKV